ncbi:MAG: hypothetical protein FJZ16_04665 [Candidatus Omnitrophica bacterium]|nr:hypothetical protein [Candidatus Omnitrophota bacterium]
MVTHIKGYNYTVDTYNPNLDPYAINKYMRDICHWMAYTVTKEDWWRNGDLVARPNTPAAIPIYGTYNHWVTVKGCVTGENPCPEPHTNPWNTPNFTVYGFWIKDPLISGLGQDTYKSAAECSLTYFLPLSTRDSYNGLLLQVAEPPAQISNATIEISKPIPDATNLINIGINNGMKDAPMAGVASVNTVSTDQGNAKVQKKNWRDLVDPYLLTDPEAVAIFEGTEMGKPILVKRLDKKNSDYYLVPFGKGVYGKGFLTSAVIILDSKGGYFKEASWTKNPERFLRVRKARALELARRYIVQNFPRVARNRLMEKRRKHISRIEAELVWQPNSFSASPYMPYWKVDIDGFILYVTQEQKVFGEKENKNRAYFIDHSHLDDVKIVVP